MKSTFSIGCRSSRMSASCWPLICGMTMSVTRTSKGRTACLDKVQRLGAAGGRHHLIPLPAQGVGGKVAHDELVFHQQHRLVALHERARAGLGRLALLLDGFRARHVDPERRPVPLLGVHPDAAPVLLHDAVARRQAEARALADLLRGEEGLEDVRLHVRVHADAGVADGEQHVRARLHGGVLARELGVEHDIARFRSPAARPPASHRAR